MKEVLAQKQFRRLWLGQLVLFGDFVALFAVTTRGHVPPSWNRRERYGNHGFLPDALRADRPDRRRFCRPVESAAHDDRQRFDSGCADHRAGLHHKPLAGYAILFAMSTVSSFFVPAQSVTVPLLVEREA